MQLKLWHRYGSMRGRAHHLEAQQTGLAQDALDGAEVGRAPLGPDGLFSACQKTPCFKKIYLLKF